VSQAACEGTGTLCAAKVRLVNSVLSTLV
jgi:hypothetical protein